MGGVQHTRRFQTQFARMEEGVQELLIILVWPVAIAAMAVMFVLALSAAEEPPLPEPVSNDGH